MMKRENNLISLIAEPDNLRLAFWKARKSKEGKMEVAYFRKFLDKNLLTLRNELPNIIKETNSLNSG